MKQYPENNNAIEIKKLLGVWPGFGNKIEIIPANTILTQIIIRQINITKCIVPGEYEIKVYFGNIGIEKEITSLSFSATTKEYTTVLKNGEKIIMPGERISAAISGNMAEEATASIVIGYDTAYSAI